MTDNQQLSMGLPTNPQDITTVGDYQFEPIKGYPMLNWKGKRPFTSTQYYPAQLKEVYGEAVEGWRNKIYWGDNLQVMSHLLKEFRGKVNLVYIDPPFDSKADYKKKVKLMGQILENNQNTFEEKQYTDIWTNDEYLQFIYERLILMRELLSKSGSIYVHSDWHKSHYLRCILNEIFGETSFRNEIVWKYSGWNKILDGSFEKRHDNIFFYVLSNNNENATFNSFCLPYGSKEDYLATRKQKIYLDKDGREYTLDTRDGGEKKTKIYVDEALRRGRPVDDVWQIDKVNNSSLEKESYPTQKPELLLERVIKSASNPGDIIFDCFMGSGTTQAVAMKLGRRFIGADINLGAVQITTKRLLSVAEELEQAQAEPAKVLQLPIPKAAPALYPIVGGKEIDSGDARRAAESGASYKTAKEGELDGEPDADQDAELETEPLTYYTGFEVYNVNHYDVFRNPVQAKDLLLEALVQQKASYAT